MGWMRRWFVPIVVAVLAAGSGAVVAEPALADPVSAPCAPGWFSATGSEPCTPAPPGYFVDIEGALSASVCPLGSYQDQAGQSSCALAPIGYYVDIVAAVAAIACPPGTSTLTQGATHVGFCLAELMPPPPATLLGFGQVGVPMNAEVRFLSPFDLSPTDFDATIDWADGTTSAGTVSSDPGGLVVSGTHTYWQAGPPLVTVSLQQRAPGDIAATALMRAIVDAGPQSISFVNAPATGTVGGSYVPVATASPSGLPVSFSVDATSTGCSLTAGTVTFDAVGTCVINADQAGNTDYLPATRVQRATVVGSTASHFTGFAAPVDNNGVLNTVKAGQVVPLKWRLTTAAGVPVTNLAAADVKVTVTGLSCSAGTTVDALEEYAAGASGLQNLGNGYYQWNWKTPKTYAGSCKTMKLDLGEAGDVTHDALFKFTK